MTIAYAVFPFDRKYSPKPTIQGDSATVIKGLMKLPDGGYTLVWDGKETPIIKQGGRIHCVSRPLPPGEVRVKEVIGLARSSQDSRAPTIERVVCQGKKEKVQAYVESAPDGCYLVEGTSGFGVIRRDGKTFPEGCWDLIWDGVAQRKPYQVP